VAGVVAAIKLSAKSSAPPAGLAAGSSTSASSSASSTTPSQSATPSSSATGSGGPAAVSGPAGVVQAYFAAINNHDCGTAWRLGGDNISAAKGQSYQQFCQGFSTTSHDNVTVDSVAGNTVTVTFVAQQTDGTSQTYRGTYVVGNGAIQTANVQAG
jgi:hypothetical protein